VFGVWEVLGGRFWEVLGGFGVFRDDDEDGWELLVVSSCFPCFCWWSEFDLLLDFLPTLCFSRPEAIDNTLVRV